MTRSETTQFRDSGKRRKKIKDNGGKDCFVAPQSVAPRNDSTVGKIPSCFAHQSIFAKVREVGTKWRFRDSGKRRKKIKDQR